MKITKVLNNCVVLAEDEERHEVIAMGNAIGFHYKKGDMVGEDEIDKIYILSNKLLRQNFVRLLEQIPKQYFDISLHIIEYAQAQIQDKLNDSIYVALTDHIHFAASRYQENIKIQNRLNWEIKKFYPREYAIGTYALDYINKQLEIELWEEEASNIALHIVNSEKDNGQMEDTVKMMNTVKDILSIISYHFKMQLDDRSVNYHRLITHLLFFVQRLMEGSLLEDEDDFLYQQIKVKYKKELACALRIQDYVETHFKRNISRDELVYLTIHIQRIASRSTQPQAAT